MQNLSRQRIGEKGDREQGQGQGQWLEEGKGAGSRDRERGTGSRESKQSHLQGVSVCAGNTKLTQTVDRARAATKERVAYQQPMTMTRQPGRQAADVPCPMLPPSTQSKGLRQLDELPHSSFNLNATDIKFTTLPQSRGVSCGLLCKGGGEVGAKGSGMSRKQPGAVREQAGTVESRGSTVTAVFNSCTKAKAEYKILCKCVRVSHCMCDSVCAFVPLYCRLFSSCLQNRSAV